MLFGVVSAPVALFVVLKCAGLPTFVTTHTLKVPTIATLLQLARHGCAVFTFKVFFRQASLWSPSFFVMSFVAVVAVAPVLSVRDDAVVVDVCCLGPVLACF